MPYIFYFIYKTEKEKKSIAKQLSVAYGILKNSENPVHLYVTSFVSDSVSGKALCSQGCKIKINFSELASNILKK